MKTLEIPVLIVGGGPVGLCTSILLSHHGVPSLLVERHTGTSLYPKARLVNTRTMEIFRECGLEQAMREISLPPEQSRHVIWARTLVGEELQRRTFDTLTPDLSEGVSPTSHRSERLWLDCVLHDKKLLEATGESFTSLLTYLEAQVLEKGETSRIDCLDPCAHSGPGHQPVSRVDQAVKVSEPKPWR